MILKFIKPFPNSVFECNNPQKIKFLKRLRLGLGHLREHKFKHSIEVESTSYFLLHCPIYNNDRSSLLSTIRSIDCKLLENTDFSLLYGILSLDIISNSLIMLLLTLFCPLKDLKKPFLRNNRCFFLIVS